MGDFFGSMFQWIWDAVEWVGDAIAYLLGSLWGLVVDQLEAIWLWAVGLFEWAWDIAFAVWFALMPVQVQNTYTELETALAAYEPYLDDVMWILPVNSTLLIISGTFIACGIVRVLRWIKSFIPTMGG